MPPQAIELDPEYAAGYALLGWTHLIDRDMQWSQDSQGLERAFELAQRAIALDDFLPHAHLLLGFVYLRKKQYEQAIVEGERAIALAPNYANAYADMGHILNFAGRPEEALGLIKKAMRLNPKYPFFFLTHLADAYYLTGQYEEAIAAAKRLLAHNPEIWIVHLRLAACYSELGREEEARAEAAEVLRLNPHYSLEVARQTWPYKDPAELERILAALRKAGLR